MNDLINILGEIYVNTIIHIEKYGHELIYGIFNSIVMSVIIFLIGIVFGIMTIVSFSHKYKLLRKTSKVYIKMFYGISFMTIWSIGIYVIFAEYSIYLISIPILAMSMNLGAYIAKITIHIVGQISYDQKETAYALGFNSLQTLNKILLPQAIREASRVYYKAWLANCKFIVLLGWFSTHTIAELKESTSKAGFTIIIPSVIVMLLNYLILIILAKFFLYLYKAIVIRCKIFNIVRKGNLDSEEHDFFEKYRHNAGREVLNIKGIRKQFGDNRVLNDVSLIVNDGEVVTVIGNKLAGKTTLLRCVSGLENVNSGTIFLNGELFERKDNEYMNYTNKASYISTKYHLFSHLTVLENLMIGPMQLLGESRQSAYNKAIELLTFVGVYEKRRLYPDKLTNGQMQRVAIARSLAMEPSLLVVDDSDEINDETLINEVSTVIKALKEKGVTILIATNDLKFAYEVSDRIAFLDNGSIYEEGNVEEIFNNPKRLKTIIYFGKLFKLQLTIKSKTFDFIDGISQIENYAKKNYLTEIQTQKIIYLYEKVCIHTIVPNMKDVFLLQFTMIYDDYNNHINVVVTYDGERFNPLEGGILEDVEDDILFTYENINRIEVVL